jgi:hypothetical protein
VSHVSVGSLIDSHTVLMYFSTWKTNGTDSDNKVFSQSEGTQFTVGGFLGVNRR